MITIWLVGYVGVAQHCNYYDKQDCGYTKLQGMAS